MMDRVVWESSILGNRRWIHAKGKDGTRFRIVVAYPFNSRALPDFVLLNPLGSAVLFFAVDAALWIFKFLPWRSVSIYKDPPRRESSWGECFDLKRRVSIDDLTETVESEVIWIQSQEWPDESASLETRAKFRRKESLVSATICLGLVVGIAAIGSGAILISLSASLGAVAVIDAAVPRVMVRGRYPQHVPTACAVLCTLVGILALLVRMNPPS